MQLSPPPRDFLTKIDEEIEICAMRMVAESTQGALLASSLICCLHHRYLRPLTELYLNDALPLHDAMVLIAYGFARVVPVDGTAEFHGGIPIHGIEMTYAGLDAYAVFKKRPRGRSDGAFNILQSEILRYAIRDAGHGICLGPDHLRQAIAARDVRILERVVDPTSPGLRAWQTRDCRMRFGQLERPPYIPPPDFDRAPTAKIWAPRGPARLTAGLALPAREMTQHDWHISACAAIQDLVTRRYEGADLSPPDAPYRDRHVMPAPRQHQVLDLRCTCQCGPKPHRHLRHRVVWCTQAIYRRMHYPDG